MASMATTALTTQTKTASIAEKKAKKKVSFLPFFFLIPIMLVLVVVMEAGFILILFGIIPTIIAFYADTSEERLKVATIACCNLSGVMPYAMDLHNAHNSWSTLTAMLSDPLIWLHMYGMAGFGYLLMRLCPMMYHLSLRAINRSLAFQMEQRQDALAKEWGEEIRSETNAPRENKTLLVR
jgi:hypothetical protein